MEEVGKLAVGAAVLIPAASVVNLALGAIAVIVFYFLFKTVYKKWIEEKVVSFAEEVGSQVEADKAKQPEPKV